jgi:hypothetical protein
MELEEEERSSSSLSSSEWEDLASDEGPPDNDDREVIYRSKDFLAVFVTLCTGASFYAPYSLLLIYYKFWMGGGGGRWGVGGGEARGPSRRGRIKGV